jgi:hypothetical protein
VGTIEPAACSAGGSVVALPGRVTSGARGSRAAARLPACDQGEVESSTSALSSVRSNVWSSTLTLAKTAGVDVFGYGAALERIYEKDELRGESL